MAIYNTALAIYYIYMPYTSYSLFTAASAAPPLITYTLSNSSYLVAKYNKAIASYLASTRFKRRGFAIAYV